MIEFLISGGPVMLPIGLASVIGLAAFLERAFALRKGRVAPRAFGIEVEELVKQGRIQDAQTLCRKASSASARMAAVALNAQGQTRGDIKERLEEAGRREAAELERYSAVLGTVATASPLLGLFGTVWGMILTFEVIQNEGLGKIADMAGGISQALITTLAGLAVGIPALVAYRWVLTRADDLLLELEELSLALLDLLASPPKQGAP